MSTEPHTKHGGTRDRDSLDYKASVTVEAD